MNRHENRAKEYLLHMLESLDRITIYTAGLSYEQFLASQLVQDAVVRNIAVIGEAAKQLMDIAPEFSRTHPEIPFAQVYGMRNRVIHGYSTVDPITVWESAQLDAPELRRQIAAVLATLP
jgi:uncharacterized protein with HEPN domain